MIIPKRHINHMTDFTETEKNQFWTTMMSYYEAGYAVLTRPAVDSNRTVADHLHTHLFKFKTPEN